MTEAVLATGFFAFARLTALFLVLPVFATQGVPKHVPVFFGLILTLLLLPAMPVVEGELTLGFLVSGIVSEALLGYLLGTLVRAVFASLTVASEIISRQTAMGMASFLDPVVTIQQSPLGILGSMMGGLVFLGFGLHQQFVIGIAETFHVIPPGQVTGLHRLHQPFLAATELLVDVGFMLAGPLLALVFVVNAFIGILARLAPRMNMFFSIGMTLNSAVGVVVLALALPWVLLTHGDLLLETVPLFSDAVEHLIGRP